MKNPKQFSDALQVLLNGYVDLKGLNDGDFRFEAMSPKGDHAVSCTLDVKFFKGKKADEHFDELKAEIETQKILNPDTIRVETFGGDEDSDFHKLMEKKFGKTYTKSKKTFDKYKKEPTEPTEEEKKELSDRVSKNHKALKDDFIEKYNLIMDVPKFLQCKILMTVTEAMALDPNHNLCSDFQLVAAMVIRDIVEFGIYPETYIGKAMIIRAIEASYDYIEKTKKHG